MHSQPGHNRVTMGETKAADRRWLVSLDMFSKDRVLYVAPLEPETEQIYDISSDEMKVVHDGPTFAEPHDVLLVRCDIVNEVNVRKRDDPMWAQTRAGADGVDIDSRADTVIRDGDTVRGDITTRAPVFSHNKVEVTGSDLDDPSHSFTLKSHGVAREVSPRPTAAVTFTAATPGVSRHDCQ